MAEVKIQVIKADLAEMEIPQECVYYPFYFAESDFSGYTAANEGLLMFYVGGGTFICRDNEKNRTLFNGIISKKALI